MTFPLFAHYLPSKSQTERYRYHERMLCAVSLKTTVIPNVIEHVRFKIQTEWLEYFVLYTYT